MEVNSSNREQEIALNNNRSLLYGFLSRMYEREIDLDLLKKLTSEKSAMSQIEASLEFDDPDLKKGFEMFGAYLRKARGRNPDEVKKELAIEYTSLFLGFMNKPLHPSESAYMSETRTTYGEARDRVMQAYWKAGLDKVKQFREPDDHVAIELQYMEYLCRITAESLEKNNVEQAKKYLEDQRSFINDHLSKWVPRFATDILESSKTDFYKGVAYITKSFVELEKDSIKDLLEEEN
jgi:anaerobic sulfite reductase subunit A